MSETIIKVRGLSKQYPIRRKERPVMIREVLMSRLTSPLAAFRSNGNRWSDETIWALNDVSFEVNRGEVIGIIGCNGSGKSTLLKILSRITKPTKGYAEIHGRVGLLLEVGTGFHPELTARENIFLNGAILGMGKREIEQKFDGIVAFAEVERFVDTPLKRFSSGMYTRLAFAVAAHLEPEILLVDEVLAVGDVSFQRKCLGKMGELADEGRTVLFVSHSMTPIVQLCTHVIWLNQGRISEKGDPREVSSHYLCANQVPLGEAIFDPHSRSTRAALVRAYVTDENSLIRSAIPYAKPFGIALEYRIEVPIDGLRLGIRLYNDRNIAVLHTTTADCSAVNGVFGKQGEHRARVDIPGAWLAPGRYYAEVGFWSQQMAHRWHVMNALSFDITGATVEHVGEEVLRPLLPWTVA